MSIENPFSVNRGWKIDPDNRQDRGSCPVTIRKMTEEEKIKYGVEDESMKMTKANVRKLAAEGMSKLEMMEYFAPDYPKMKKTLILAKIELYLSDKKPGGQRKKEEPVKVDDERLSQELGEQKCRICGCTQNNACEGGCYWVESDLCSECVKKGESNIKEVAEKVAQDVSRAAQESVEKIKLKQAIDEMMELVPDNINHPAYYTAGKIEVIDIIQDQLTAEEFEGFIKGVVVQYIFRSRLKGGLDDLKKAQWYLSRIIGVMETA